MERMLVGKITNPHGLRGDIKIFPYVTDKEEFNDFSYLIIEGDDRKHKIASLRFHKNLILAKLKGFNHINEVEGLKNKNVYVLKEDMPELDEDTFYVSDVVGYAVHDQEHGHVGQVKDVVIGSAQDLFVIKRDNGDEFMIPAVKAFILSFDHEAKVLHVQTIKGMIDEV